jgi:hypothetical protein
VVAKCQTEQGLGPCSVWLIIINHFPCTAILCSLFWVTPSPSNHADSSRPLLHPDPNATPLYNQSLLPAHLPSHHARAIIIDSGSLLTLKKKDMVRLPSPPFFPPIAHPLPISVLFSSKKYAWSVFFISFSSPLVPQTNNSETCIKGHRSSACQHTERPLFEIKKKGRPVTQCEHCRELRKTKQVHVKCLCSNKQQQQQQQQEESRNGAQSSLFKKGRFGLFFYVVGRY